MQNIILSQKPAISTTMTSLPPVLLEQLLTELSTLASVYHKPPEAFVGKGRFGADAIQRAAIQEQLENLEENPIAASVATTNAANGSGGASQNNLENLLDIDFDGAAPASAEHNLGMPDRSGTPSAPAVASAGGSSSMADMMDLFGGDGPAPATTQSPPPGMGSMMGGFAALDIGATSQPPPPQQQLGKKASDPKSGSDDLLGLF